MIIVKDIAIIVTPGDTIKSSFTHPVIAQWESSGEQFITEDVIGKRFRNSNGVDVVIGMTQTVQDAIGLPMKAFSDMSQTILETQEMNKILQKENDNLITQCHVTKLRWNHITNASIWRRLKWLFIGVK